RRRLSTLLRHDIGLLAYHLPLDAHAELGNNATLAARLGFQVEGCADGELGEGLVWLGRTAEAMNAAALAEHVGARLGRCPMLVESPLVGEVHRVAWCTGGAQDMIIQA